MYKKIITVLLIILFAVTLSACSLVDIPQDNTGGDNSSANGYKGRFLCGFHVYFYINDWVAFPTDDLSDDNAIAIYANKTYTGDSSFISFETRGNGIDSRINTNGKLFEDEDNSLDINATIYYTYELMNSSVNVDYLCYNRLIQDIIPAGNNESSTIGLGSQAVKHSLSKQQTLTANTKTSNIKDEVGVNREIKYTAQINIDFVKLDYLRSARKKLYDNNNNLIKTVEYSANSVNDSVSNVKYAYAIIEEDYEIMDNSKSHIGQMKGDKYTQRYLYNYDKFSEQSHNFKFPLGNGLVKIVRA